MKILFYDIVQLSAAPASLKSAALADRWNGTSVTFNLDGPREITCAGIGYTDARSIQLSFRQATLLDIEGNTVTPAPIYDGGRTYVSYDLDIESNDPGSASNTSQTITFQESGLYRIKPIVADRITLTHDGSYIGRFGAGIAVDLPTAVAKEPGWESSAESRKTLSGQEIPGAGGYTYRVVTLDTRYRIGSAAMNQIALAYNNQIGKGFPFFLLFDREAKKMPFLRLYGKDTGADKYVFQGGITRYLYSRKFTFEERF